MSFGLRRTFGYWVGRSCGLLVLVLAWWAALSTGLWWWVIAAIASTGDMLADVWQLWLERRDRRA